MPRRSGEASLEYLHEAKAVSWTFRADVDRARRCTHLQDCKKRRHFVRGIGSTGAANRRRGTGGSTGVSSHSTCHIRLIASRFPS
jgi:hypothetical protein